MRETRQSNLKLMDSESLDFSEISIKIKGKAQKLPKCRFCETVLSKRTVSSMKSHRITCKMTDVKEESLNENENYQIPMDQINIVSCIVCNSVTKLYEYNIGELMSQHSEARMCDLIQRCLGASKLNRNIEDESYNLRICYDCVSKLNEYDLACVTAERVAYELQQMLLQTDQLHVENDALKTNKIETRRSTAMSEDSNYCFDNNDEDETDDFCVSVDKVEVFESPTLRTHDEHHENDDALSDSENDSNESIGNGIQNVADSTKAKRIYECDTCPQKFNLWKELRKHRSEHRNEEAKYRCDICNFDPKNEAALAEHKKMHIGLSPLQCVVCKKAFSHKRNIRPHMRLHTGQKKYQCDRCGKEYFHKSSFSLHMAYHDGIRTEICPHCPRQFMVKTDLEKHIRIHTGEKPFPCGVCGKRFARRDNMREHQKIHDKNETGKAYPCTYCDASFARPSKLHKHLEKHGVMTFARDIRTNNEFIKNDNNR